MKLFKKRVLRKIYGPKREEVVEGWRRQHNEERHYLYISPNVIRVIKSKSGMDRACSMHGRDEKCISNFGQKTRKEDTTWKT
jgi:hypothetical protein